MTQLDTDTELRSFINQQIYEFEQLVLDNAKIEVVLKNPEKTLKRLNKLEDFEKYEEKSHQYCIAIQITVEKSKVTSYGFADDIYDAVVFAKNEMLKTLHENLNNSISTTQQLNEVEQIRQGLGIKH